MTNAALFGCGIAASLTAFMGTCLFGDRLDAEWGFWTIALIVAHARLYGMPRPQYYRPQQLQYAQYVPNVPLAPVGQHPVGTPEN